MYIHIIQHEVFEAPGAFLEWAKEKNHTISFSKVYENQPLPASAQNIDMLIVLGGPQSPDTSTAECPHFDAKAEIEVIKKCVDSHKIVVGVCLGSQLISIAMGAKFAHSPEKEIGVFPIRLTEEGLRDELINHFGTTLNVGHWHNDMPGLTTESKLLATSQGCPRQIVSYTPLVYGFQCHLELTKQVVELLVVSDAEILSNNANYRFVQSADDILKYDYDNMNEKLCKFLDKLTHRYLNL